MRLSAAVQKWLDHISSQAVAAQKQSHVISQGEIKAFLCICNGVEDGATLNPL
jgi:hypothetical protein